MVYVKRFPESWTEKTLSEYFEPFGKIKRLSLKLSELGAAGIICYDDEEGLDLEYGSKCAQKAIETLNGRYMGNNLKLFVKYFIQKSDREHEINYYAIRTAFQNNACLCVKNLPNHWKQQDLSNIFKIYG